MPEYHTQPAPSWRDRFTERERPRPALAGPIANCRQYAQNDPAGLPGHQLMLIIARLADTLDTLPLQSVAEPIPDVLSSFFDEKWEQGKLSELWTEEDEAALLPVLGPYLVD